MPKQTNPTTENALSSPVISAQETLNEITFKGLLLGAFLAMILAAANAYIGLLIGLTVSASIPAAALSMGVLRLFKNSHILENNMVQTAASAGEALVAGIIFTIPALVLMHAWSGYDYWPLVSIAVIGGILGVIFTIPLRKALIVEAQLTFPEGIATAEVLKSGHKIPPISKLQPSTSGLRHLLQAAGIGMLFKLFESGFGMFAGWVSTVQAVFNGKLLLAINFSISPALIGVGYIVGLNIAILVFAGGVIGTLIGVPVNWLINHEQLLMQLNITSTIAWQDITHSQWQQIAHITWDQNRRIGVGAMIVGGLWSLITLFKPLCLGIKASIKAYKVSLDKSAKPLERTEQDTPFNYLIMAVVASSIPLFFIFQTAISEYPQSHFIAGVMTLLMLIFGFIFASVAGYMAGLVGSSNNPISGVTIATVIVSALILLQLIGNQGIAAQIGPIAVIYLAGLICSAAAIAGDNMQDLKCGHILGATPWKQQLYQVVGVISAACVIPFVLQILDTGYGIGRPSPTSGHNQFLAAPQAGLIKDLATGIFGAGIDWLFILIGCGLAIVLIILDEIQRLKNASFRIPILAVAVGIYLPVGLSIPIFIGGLVAHLINRKNKQSTESIKAARKNTGLLVASGLITGEALMGVIMAIFAAFIFDLPATMKYAEITGLIMLSIIIVYLYKRPISAN